MLFERGHFSSSSKLTITDLPREVIRLIALKIYDPLELTQQDRLTWGIFSTVDMHQERQDDLASLISLGMVCRKIRKEVRRILFQCVRVSGVPWAEEVIQNRDGWARYVKSIIIDLSMFDSDPEASTRTRLSPIESQQPISNNNSSNLNENSLSKPRTCWAESSLLTSLFNSLPSLNHLSFFADASDDSTLALLFASLIPHPSLHDIPPTLLSNSPSTLSTISGLGGGGNKQQQQQSIINTWIPLTHRLKSFGWRQRATPPLNFRQFSQSSTFVSILHLIRHSHNLSFLVLDADLDEMTPSDVLSPLKELSLRKPPIGEKNQLVSLMLCGPIKNWESDFLNHLVNAYSGIKELFIDRPLKKSTEVKATSFKDFTKLLEPLSTLPYLRLLQVGSYTFTTSVQLRIVQNLSRTNSSLLVVGLLGEEGETIWWGIWRRASFRGLGSSIIISEGQGDREEVGEYDELTDIRIKFLNDGDLLKLEEENEDWLKKSQPPSPPTFNINPFQTTNEFINFNDIDKFDYTNNNHSFNNNNNNNEDIRMTPRNTQSPLISPKEQERIQALGLNLDGIESYSIQSQQEERGNGIGEGKNMMDLNRLMD